MSDKLNKNQVETTAGTNINTDGGINNFYAIPDWVRDVDDLAEHLKLDGFLFNILKSMFGMSESRHKGTSVERDAKKILHYAIKNYLRVKRNDPKLDNHMNYSDIVYMLVNDMRKYSPDLYQKFVDKFNVSNTTIYDVEWMTKNFEDRSSHTACYGTVFNNVTKKGKYIGNWNNSGIHNYIKTVVLNNKGVVVCDYVDNMKLQVDQTVMLQIPHYHVIHKSYKGKTYILFHIEPFTYSPDNGLTIWNSHIDEAFDTAEGVKDYRYVGVYESYLGRSTHDVLPTVSKTRAQFRDQHEAFGEGYTQLDYYTYQMVHRLMRAEVRMLMPDDITMWRGLHLSTSLWYEFLDGINIHNGKVYLAKPKSKFSDDTSDEPYKDTGLSIPNRAGKITSYHDGTFLPERVVDDKLTHNYSYRDGWRVVLVGTQLDNSARGGPSAFFAYVSSAILYSDVGSRAVY